MKHPIPVRIPELLQRKVRREAKHEGLSSSAVIRRIIIRHYQTARAKEADR